MDNGDGAVKRDVWNDEGEGGTRGTGVVSFRGSGMRRVLTLGQAA